MLDTAGGWCKQDKGVKSAFDPILPGDSSMVKENIVRRFSTVYFHLEFELLIFSPCFPYSVICKIF